MRRVLGLVGIAGALAAMLYVLSGDGETVGASVGAEVTGEPTGGEMVSGEDQVDRIRGRTIRWTWTEGPVAGTTHEHEFNEDGSVVWRVVDGPNAGHSAREEEYAAVRVSDDVHVVSYLAGSGYTLTVALNFGNHTMVGFASGADEWYPGEGTFEVVE